MIDSHAKLNALCTSLAHANNRLGCVVHSPLELHDLIRQFIKSGGNCEDLFRIFEEAERPRKSRRWEAGSTLVSPVAIHAGAR